MVFLSFSIPSFSIPSSNGKNNVCSEVIVHPGHGGIEEHCVPYYIKEIKKALRNSEWIG